MAEQPIKPPQELARQWAIDSLGQKPPWLHGDDLTPACMLVAAKAARWGWEQRGAVNEAELQRARDEELEACCEWLRSAGIIKQFIAAFRAARRPKPPSLAEQGLIELGSLVDDLRLHGLYYSSGTIRAALERLKKLEEANG